MEVKKIICLFLFVSFILIFSACHPRHVSDINPAMTKEEVISLWGRTNLITYKTTNGTTQETWEYHFATSGTICEITFIQDKVANTICRPMSEERYYLMSERRLYPEPYYYPYLFPYYYPYPYYYFGYYHFPRPYHYPHPHRHHHHRK
jgi:hypothetical protein